MYRSATAWMLATIIRLTISLVAVWEFVQRLNAVLGEVQAKLHDALRVLKYH